MDQNQSPGKNRSSSLRSASSVIKPTFKSPEMLAPARMPVADGKKMENKLKKEPSGPRQLGTKFWAKMSAGKEAEEKHLGPLDRLLLAEASQCWMEAHR